jgi:hypothetical protein
VPYIPSDAERMAGAGSTNVVEAYYSAAFWRLFVRFRDGSLYQYDGITPGTWLSLKSAGSKGRFVLDTLRGANGRRGKGLLTVLDSKFAYRRIG